MRQRVALVVVVITALAATPVALADNGTSQEGYGGEPAVQVTLSQSAPTQSEDVLPVTGMELGLVFLAGTLLVFVGAGINRVARRQR